MTNKQKALEALDYIQHSWQQKDGVDVFQEECEIIRAELTESVKCSHIFMVEDSHLKCMGCGVVVSEPYKVPEFLKTLDTEKINLVIFPSDYTPKDIGVNK